MNNSEQKRYLNDSNDVNDRPAKKLAPSTVKITDVMAAKLIRSETETDVQWKERQRQHKRDIVSRYDSKKIHRENRPIRVLQMECEIRGIHSAGIRIVLLARLQDADDGKNVIEANLVKPVFRVADELQFTEMHRGTARLNGEDRFLGLPHDLIRTSLFPFVTTPGLFLLSRSCKYLQADAIYTLRQRSIQVFGSGGTPKALSFLQYFCIHDHLKKKLFQVSDRWFAKYTHLPSRTEEFSLAKLGITKHWPVVFACVMSMIEHFGTVDARICDLERRVKLKVERERERLFVLKSSMERAQMLYDALEILGQPPILAPFQISAEHKKPVTPSGDLINTNKAPLTLFGQFIQMDYSFILKQMCRFVFLNLPQKCETVVKQYADYLQIHYTLRGSQCLLRIMRALHLAEKEFDDRNLNHESVWHYIEFIFGWNMKEKRCFNDTVFGHSITDTNLHKLMSWILNQSSRPVDHHSSIRLFAIHVDDIENHPPQEFLFERTPFLEPFAGELIEKILSFEQLANFDLSSNIMQLRGNAMHIWRECATLSLSQFSHDIPRVNSDPTGPLMKTRPKFPHIVLSLKEIQ